MYPVNYRCLFFCYVEGLDYLVSAFTKPIVCKEFFSMYLTTLVRGMAKLGGRMSFLLRRPYVGEGWGNAQ